MIFKTEKTECNCCHPAEKGKSICPRCGEPAKTVPVITLETLLKPEAKAALESLEGFHFCKTPACDVVYFRGDIMLFTIPVGIKEGTVPTTLCYCFGWTKEKIEEELKTKGKTTALDDIEAKMKDRGCACNIRNPSGHCCLADVTHAVKELKTFLSKTY